MQRLSCIFEIQLYLDSSLYLFCFREGLKALRMTNVVSEMSEAKPLLSHADEENQEDTKQTQVCPFNLDVVINCVF